MALSLLIFGFILGPAQSASQENGFDPIQSLLGEWQGEGKGFGNEKSKIKSSFHLIMDGKYIQVVNESVFEPTEINLEGERHQDNGFISFDQHRKKLVYRQFNNEGYVNQYVLNDSLSDDSILVFETEIIENFVPGGKARWTIKKITDGEIETIFDVSFPGQEYSCIGINRLRKL